MAGQASSLSGSAGFQPAPVEGEIRPELLTSDDKWILLKLDQAIRDIDAAFAGFKFSEVTQTLYRFFWSEYCDWYVEASKAALARPAEPSNRENADSTSPAAAAQSGLAEGREAVGAATPQRYNGSTTESSRANKIAVIDFVLSHTLRLFHPFLPFITEELWHGLGYNLDLPPNQGGETVMFAHWPKPLDDDFKTHYRLSENEGRFVDAKYELVGRGRNLRREFNLASNKKLKFVLRVKDPLPPQEADVVRLLLNAETLDLDPNYVPKKGTPSAMTDLGELFLPLEGLVDLEAERARLKRELAKTDVEIQKTQSKLNNRDFTQKAPSQVLEEHRKRLADLLAKQHQVKSALDSLGA